MLDFVDKTLLRYKLNRSVRPFTSGALIYSNKMITKIKPARNVNNRVKMELTKRNHDARIEAARTNQSLVKNKHACNGLIN